MSDEPTFNNLGSLPLPWEASRRSFDSWGLPKWWITHEGDIAFQPLKEFPGDTPETVEARARLWAAAPELLEAAVEALLLLGSDCDDYERLGKAHHALNKAIYKATGRDIMEEDRGETFPIPWHCSDCGATWEASLAKFPEQAHCPQCQSVHIY